MKRYNVVFFDLDDTLFDTSGDEIRAIEAVFKKHGLPFGADVVDAYNNRTPWQAFTLGEYDAKAEFTARFVQLLDNLSVKDNRQQLIDDYFELMEQSNTVNEGVCEVLDELKANGYKLYITANGYSDFQRNRIASSKIADRFDGIFISDEFDLRKPSRAYFDYVFNRVPESNRSKVLVVGDAQSTDILGANNAKLDCCWFNPKRKQPKHKSTYEVDNFGDIKNLLIKQ